MLVKEKYYVAATELKMDSGLEDDVINSLALYGYAVAPDAVGVDDLFEDAKLAEYRRAGIGRGDLQIADEIRRDEISWFEPASLRAPQARLWQTLETLRVRLNQELFMGLWDIEGHYAKYPPGGFYQRHLDRFNDSSARAVSLVLYLNRDWTPKDGGQLRLHLQNGAIDVEPRAGTLVVFLSDRIEHEVLPATRERRSFAAWFRTRQ